MKEHPASGEQVAQEFAEMAECLQNTLIPMALAFDRFKKTCRFFHFGKSKKDNSVLEKLIAARKRASGRDLKPCESCQSDLSIFLKHGSPRAFGIGRNFGDYGGSHQADKYIACDRLLEFKQIFAEIFAGE
ncbi:MAG: hypothetical protein IJF02_07090 [Oscillospiraceae bacterium]|nr:hypothetical protein [Oscillospiraceae bacterium]